MVDDEHIKPYDTAELLQLEDDDVLDAVIEYSNVAAQRPSKQLRFTPALIWH